MDTLITETRDTESRIKAIGHELALRPYVSKVNDAAYTYTNAHAYDRYV